MVGYIILGAFCYFLFMWLFRMIFIIMIMKVIGKIIEEKTKNIKGMFNGEKGE